MKFNDTKGKSNEKIRDKCKRCFQGISLYFISEPDAHYNRSVVILFSYTIF